MTAHIIDVASRFPPHYYKQEEVMEMLRDDFWRKHVRNVSRLESIHRNAGIKRRHLALPLSEYKNLEDFETSNTIWIQMATTLGEETLCALFQQTAFDPQDVAALAFTTITGIAVPSLDARLMNRISFPRHMKRMPLFGLGCMGGAASTARIADYLQGHPDEAGIVLAVELCSLTLQGHDCSLANIVASGLFSDGVGALLMVGSEHPLAQEGQPQVLGSRSCFFPETEYIMGWNMNNRGFGVLLSADVADIARAHLPAAIQAFLAEYSLTKDDITHWIVHPGGPKVMTAIEEGLDLEQDALQLSRESLCEFGNVSSVSVLLILQETMRRHRPEPGSYGFMMAMGPGFSAELLLLRW